MSLKWTGERYIPWMAEETAQIHYEHIHRYAFASMFTKGKNILDMACGEGYGSYMLSNDAKYVVGIDIDDKAVEHARNKYIKQNLEFIRGSILDIPIKKDEKFDVIVCFEAIEHIDEQEKLLSEVKRLLNENGIFIISTPNKLTYTDERENFINPFHKKELYFGEFRELLSGYFKNVVFFGQKVYGTSNIWPLPPSEYSSAREFVIEKKNNEFFFSETSKKIPEYLIVIASDKEFPHLDALTSTQLIDASNILLNFFEKQVKTLIEKEKLVAELNHTLMEKDAKIRNLETYNKNLETHNKSLETSLKSLESALKQSIIWQTNMKLQRFIEKIMPYGWLKFWSDKKKIIDTYDSWILQNEPDKKELRKIMEGIKDFKYNPKISIVIPVWNTYKKFLELAIESVLKQTYDNWELCIADGGSTNPDVKTILKKYIAKDPRIKVTFLSKNRGIALNSNEAISLATGEFIGLLDHDDELSPFALYEVVKWLNEHPDADLIYSDEDRLSPEGYRIDPFFKPDWSLPMFLSTNYICHFLVYRHSLLQKVSGFREGFDGSQDYDLALRAVEKTSEEKIYHIPRVLYHWRITPLSSSSGREAKPYAYIAGKKALEDYLSRNNIEGEVIELKDPGSYRVKKKIRNMPSLNLIIVPD
ncbi:MAG TPA: glycosyltransferase, partial [Candidatus Methylomirabilis sp.]|nr:glycosyltransferase [Candidatus Methylomirabilis sp.]